MANAVAPLGDVLPALAAAGDRLLALPATDQKVALLEAVLAELFAAPSADTDLVALAHRHLLDPDIATVEQLAEATGLPKARLSRLSVRAFGFPPKVLLRRQRFLRTLSVMRERLSEPWTSLIDPIYVDQSHFIRDFRYFMDMPPRAYFALPHAILAPAALERATVIGASLQGLHGAA